jgi:hypothetical protein
MILLNIYIYIFNVICSQEVWSLNKKHSIKNRAIRT